MNKSEKFWDKRAVKYDKDEKDWSQTYNKAVENTKKYLNNDDTLLDFGCGSGILTLRFTDLVKEIHAIDISSKIIEAAKERAKGNNIENISYVQTTIFDERYKKESFNVVLAYNILHLVEDIQRTIQRIYEILKPGGMFISETVCLREKKSFSSKLIVFISKTKLVPPVENLKSTDLENMIIDCGFEIIETEILGQSVPNYFVVAKKIGV